MTDSLHDPDENIGRVLTRRLSRRYLHRYAPSPGQLDWANQPDPFRAFADSSTVELPLLADAITVLRVSTLSVHQAPAVGLNTVAALFELALGLSAWKEYRGYRGRCAAIRPAATCHPTEGYAVLPPCRASKRASITMSAAIMPGTRRLLAATRPLDSPGLPAASWSGCRPFPGGSLEIWRVGLPLLSARRRPCPRRRTLCGGRPGLVGPVARSPRR